LWDITVSVLLTIVELIAAAFIFAPRQTKEWVRKRVRRVREELSSRRPAPRWESRRGEAAR
jgi:hypothetical protein